jgi:hypothetical protein
VRRGLEIFGGYLVQFLKVRLAYRAEVLGEILSGALGTAASLLFVLLLFERTPRLAGWTREEAIFVFGFSMIPYGLYSVVSMNLYEFADRYVVEGRFDRVLLRPVNSFFQVLFESFRLTPLGDVAVGVYFFPAKGQLQYPPNGLVGCAIFKDQGSIWGVVDTTQLCEVHLTALQFASAPDVCDGALVGTFNGIFSGNAPLAGSFALPLALAESQTKPPGCQPPNGPCAQHSDCCSSSCSIYIGVCN